jgi:hypothetical protein
MYFNLRQTINLPFVSFQKAKNAGQVPFWIVSAIAVYTPFEDFLVGWLPIPQVAQTGVRFIPEIFLYYLLLQLIYRKIRSEEGLRKTPIDILVVAFFVSSLISILVNHASIPGSIANLRTNWRYLSIYYLLVNINITQQQLASIIRKIIAIGVIQSAITFLQFFLPGSLKMAISGGYCDKALSKNANCGTFFDSAILSGFLLVIITIIFSDIYISSGSLVPDKSHFINIFLTYFATFASKKRAALLVALLIPLVVFWSLRKVKNLAIITWVAILLMFLTSFLSPTGNMQKSYTTNPITGQVEESTDVSTYFSSVFSEEYWQHTWKSSRGWMIATTTNALIRSGSWFGFGPELGSVNQGILPYLLEPEDQARLERNQFVFDDPYWFAVIAYFGIVGLSIYWLILWRLYQAAKFVLISSVSQPERNIALMSKTLVIIAFFYSFVERLFRLRPFSLYFWLICGLLINIYCCHQERLIKPDRQTKI